MNSKLAIDLNLDAGEVSTALFDGSEEKLYQYVSSVNIACGGHAGDERSMRQAVRLARKYQLTVGAHPSFPDRQGFGRRPVVMDSGELKATLVDQIRALQAVCISEGLVLTHVKPHGALYNVAAEQEEIAFSVLAAVREVDPRLAIVGLANSNFIRLIRVHGLTALEEAFADRVYEANGTLRSRQHSDALIKDPQVAAAQALQIVKQLCVRSISGELVPINADTICIHGDSENALGIAQAVHRAMLVMS